MPESVELTIGQILHCLDASTPEELLGILEESFGRQRAHTVTWKHQGKGVEFTDHLTRNLLPQLSLVTEDRKGEHRRIWHYITPYGTTREFAAVYTWARVRRNSYKGVLQLHVER